MTRTIEKLLDEIEGGRVVIEGAKISETGRLKVFLFNPSVGAHFEDEVEETKGISIPRPEELSESCWEVINVIGALSNLQEKRPELRSRIDKLKEKIIERSACKLKKVV
jgi:hypothetical protein